MIGAVRVEGEGHVVFVGGDDEGVAAGVRRPPGGEVCAHVADTGEEEAQVAFFCGFVSGDDVVGGGADGGDGFCEGFPEGGEVGAIVGAAYFVVAVPGAGAMEFPSATAGEGFLGDGDAGGEVGGVVCGGVAAGGVVCGGEVAGAGVELPVAGEDGEFVSFFVVGAGG